MSISFNTDINAVVSQMKTDSAKKDSKTAELESRLKSNLSGASDDELMKVCKSFESYLVEQVMTRVKDALAPEDEDKENDYLSMFGDMLYEKYAEQIAQNGELGLAQQLYESMKRDYGSSASPVSSIES